MSLESGATVGPYEIVAPLGAGGMGEVYRAHDRKLGRDIALKILSEHLSSNHEYLRRFEQEARAASALNHPNIVTIHDVGQSGGLSYIAMELIDGHDLRNLSSEGRLPLKQVMRIASKVADGLAAAHERGIVHRDLKPENVIVSNTGFVKIVDFGLAKLVRPFGFDDSTLPQTTPGAIFGTVGYMSPEQVAGKPTDFRSDQFSFGVILYELIVGRRPFDRGSGSETLASILRDEAPSILDANDRLPPELARVVARCLAKDPRDRYAATADLARDLREIRDTLSNISSGRRSTPPLARVPRRIGPLVTSAVAVVVIFGAIYLGSREGTGRNTDGRNGGNRITSVAVLPFQDIAGSSTTRSFIDGLAETITTRLASNPTLRVSMPFDAPQLPANLPVTEVAKRRHADVLLRCAVQESGSQLRVTYTVLDGRTGRQLAANTTTGSATDIFAFQDAVAEDVLRGLQAPAGTRPVNASVMPTLGRPDDQKLYLEALGLLQRSRDEQAVDGAIERLEKLLVDARDSVSVNSALSRAYLAKYSFSHKPAAVDQASLYADRALQFGSASPSAHVAVGQVALVRGNSAAAVTEFDRALALDPKMFQAVLGLARAYEQMGRAADAEQKYAAAIALRPDHYITYNMYGAFALRNGRGTKAVELFRQVIALAPDVPRGYNNLGAAYQRLGRYDEAADAYRKSIALDPNGQAYSNLGTCELFEGRFADACVSFEQAARLSPTDYMVWLNLGDAYRWADGQHEKAPSAYRRGIALAAEGLRVNPRDPLPHALSASAYGKLGDLEAAQREIDMALRLDPTDKDVLYQAAVVALLQKDKELAVYRLRRAVAAGYGADDAQRDPELKPLRDAPAFAEALQGKKPT